MLLSPCCRDRFLGWTVLFQLPAGLSHVLCATLLPHVRPCRRHFRDGWAMDVISRSAHSPPLWPLEGRVSSLSATRSLCRLTASTRQLPLLRCCTPSPILCLRFFIQHCSVFYAPCQSQPLLCSLTSTGASDGFPHAPMCIHAGGASNLLCVLLCFCRHEAGTLCTGSSFLLFMRCCVCREQVGRSCLMAPPCSQQLKVGPVVGT